MVVWYTTVATVATMMNTRTNIHKQMRMGVLYRLYAENQAYCITPDKDGKNYLRKVKIKILCHNFILGVDV